MRCHCVSVACECMPLFWPALFKRKLLVLKDGDEPFQLKELDVGLLSLCSQRFTVENCSKKSPVLCFGLLGCSVVLHAGPYFIHPSTIYGDMSHTIIDCLCLFMLRPPVWNCDRKRFPLVFCRELGKVPSFHSSVSSIIDVLREMPVTQQMIWHCNLNVGFVLVRHELMDDNTTQ